MSSLAVDRLEGIVLDIVSDETVSVARKVATVSAVVVGDEVSDEEKEISEDGEGASEKELTSEVAWEVSNVNVRASSVDVVVSSVGAYVSSTCEDVLVVVVISGCVIEAVVVSGTSPPVSGATAYGGSKSPKFPHALQGEAQDLTGLGAARMGSHRPLGAAVAITDSASVWGQSVPRSLKVSCRVIDSSGMIVDT